MARAASSWDETRFEIEQALESQPVEHAGAQVPGPSLDLLTDLMSLATRLHLHSDGSDQQALITLGRELPILMGVTPVTHVRQATALHNVAMQIEPMGRIAAVLRGVSYSEVEKEGFRRLVTELVKATRGAREVRNAAAHRGPLLRNEEFVAARRLALELLVSLLSHESSRMSARAVGRFLVPLLRADRALPPVMDPASFSDLTVRALEAAYRECTLRSATGKVVALSDALWFNRWTLVGPELAGKSAALRWIELKLASGEGPPVIPVHIVLSDDPVAACGDWRTLLKSRFSELGIEPIRATPSFAQPYFVFDDFDAMPLTYKRAFPEAVHRNLRRISNARAVISYTRREDGLGPVWDFEQYDIAPWTDEEVQGFLLDRGRPELIDHIVLDPESAWRLAGVASILVHTEGLERELAMSTDFRIEALKSLVDVFRKRWEDTPGATAWSVAARVFGSLADALLTSPTRTVTARQFDRLLRKTGVEQDALEAFIAVGLKAKVLRIAQGKYTFRYRILERAFREMST